MQLFSRTSIWKYIVNLGGEKKGDTCQFLGSDAAIFEMREHIHVVVVKFTCQNRMKPIIWACIRVPFKSPQMDVSFSVNILL